MVATLFSTENSKLRYKLDIHPVLKASGSRLLFDKLAKELNLTPDDFMGVCWGNPDHSISIDTEDRNHTVICFNLDKLDAISKLLNVNIYLG